jgi:hypothetical protein
MCDRFCPMGYLVFAAFATGLVWLYAVTAHLQLP